MAKTAQRTDGPRDFLAGGGEMGERIRAFEWSGTSIGPIEHWPQSLKTAVQIMLNSRYPMFVWWGAELTNLYNDNHIAVHGKRHPALGRSARDVWAEAWDRLGPQTDNVMNEGQATWNDEVLLVLERNDFKEETYFTFSYSPIAGDHGEVGGLFGVCTEDTAKVIGKRRLKALRDLGERTLEESRTAEGACYASAAVLEQNPFELPFALIYLLDNDGRHAVLNGSVRMEKGGGSAPEKIEIGSGQDVWDFGAVLESGKRRIVEDIERKFGRLSAGAWADDSTKKAVVLPLAKVGRQEFLAGFLVAGISTRLVFDDDYCGFLELVAGHIATAIVNARAHEEVCKRAEALAELDRAKTAFFSNVSHEFRTPLTLLLGPAEDMLAMKHGVLSGPVTEQIEVMHRNALRLQKLVNTLLDFSRIEAGRAQASYVETDLATLTADFASLFRSAMDKAGLTFRVDCPPLPQPVFVDRDMWEKVVFNLLSNAFKFTLEGEVEVSIRTEYSGLRAEVSGEAVSHQQSDVSSSADGSALSPQHSALQTPHVVLTVRDTGVGIPADELPNVFQRFHRIEGRRGRTHEGTGIGLSLVQELVKLHAGTIEVESELERGTVFHVRIPFGNTHLPADRIGAEHTQGSPAFHAEAFVMEALSWLPGEDSAECSVLSAEGNSGQMLPTQDSALDPQHSRPRVLVVEDNADMREYLRRLLQSRYSVETVQDGAAALATARTHPPHLIVSDVMMPEMNGFELVQQVRADDRLRPTPIILLSARAGEEACVEGVSQGADDYLTKPFSARELLARVATQLELSRIRQAAAKDARRHEDELGASDERVRHTNTELAQRVTELKKANVETRESRRAALNLMEDAVRSRQAMEGLNAELRESEDRYRTLFTSAPMAVFFCDSNAVIQYYNQQAMELWGREPECGVEQYCGSVKLWFPDGTLLPHAQKPIVDVLRSGVAAHNMEMFIERPDGSRVPVLMNCVAVKNAHGDIVGAITSFQDITERKQAEERLKQFTVELEQRVSERTQELVQSEDRLRALATELNLAEQRERKRLATDLHDYLAQLLVLGRMTLAQAKRTGLPPRGEDFVKDTEEILGKALTYCRTLMAELSPPVLQQQGLPAGLKWLADHMQRHELVVTVDMEQAGDVPLPEDRAVLLFQSVRELLINVAKHAAAKEATVRMVNECGLLKIVVRDENGFDLAAAAAAAADNTSSLSSKFGLFSIRERMKALGGRFDIQSVPGEGTTATLTLPVAARTEDSGLRTESSEKPVGRQPSLISSLSDHSVLGTQSSALQKNARVRVLLVDDHTVMREGLRSIVTGYHHLEVVGEAGDGVEAVELAQRLDPDVVVMDINMPNMDGIEATRRIKMERPNTVVIGLSVNQSTDTERKMKAAGAAAYLTKESAADALCQAIDTALSHIQGTVARQAC